MAETRVVQQAKIERERMSGSEFFARFAAPLTILVLIVFNSLFAKNFLNVNTLWNVLNQSTTLAFVAMGMTVVASAGCIDLSMGSIVAFSGMMFTLVLQATGNALLGTLAALLITPVFGVISGYFVGKWKIQPMIATLIMQMIIRGLARTVSNSRTVFLSEYPIMQQLGLYRFKNLGNMPIQVIPLVLIVVITWFLLKKTPFGKKVEAAGANDRATRLSGISSVGIIIMAYVVSALFASIGGVLEVFRLSAMDPATVGIQLEMNAIAAITIGGTSMRGGRARVLGSFLGVLVMTLITTTVNVNGAPFAVANLTKAIVIIVAVAIQSERKS